MSEEQSLKDKTAKGLFWGGFSNGIQQLLNLVFGIFIARLLTPSDYGMVGMLAIFSLIAGLDTGEWLHGRSCQQERGDTQRLQCCILV